MLRKVSRHVVPLVSYGELAIGWRTSLMLRTIGVLKPLWALLNALTPKPSGRFGSPNLDSEITLSLTEADFLFCFLLL